MLLEKSDTWKASVDDVMEESKKVEACGTARTLIE